MKDPIPVRLCHPGVYVVAAVAKFGDLFGQQLHALSRVTENDALVDLERVKVHMRAKLLGTDQ